MGFYRKSGKKEGGQKPPQKPPAPQRPAGQRPIQRPPLEDNRQTAPPSEEISGYEPTVFSKEVPEKDVQPGGTPKSPPVGVPQGPTASPKSPAVPPPIPKDSRQAPDVGQEQPSEVIIKAESYQSRLVSILEEKAPVDERQEKIEKLLDEATTFLRSKKKENHTREELERLNNVVGAINQWLVELKDHAEFRANKDAAKSQPVPSPLPVESPIPTASPLPSSVQTVQLSNNIVQLSNNIAVGPAPQPEQKPSAFWRFVSSPVTWAVTILSAFGGVLFWQNAFKDIADVVGRLPKIKTPSVKLTMIAYGSVAVGIVVITGLVNWLRNRRAERKENMQNGGLIGQ